MGAPGEKLSEETKAKIGAAAKKRYLESLENRPMPLPQKPCSKCRRVKPLREFYIRKTQLKSGLVSEIPDSWCKECTIRIQKERWQRLKDEGVDVKAIKRRHHENGDAERRRERRREYQAIQRRIEGRPVTGSRKVKQGLRAGDHYEIEPIVGLLERELQGRDQETVAAACKLDQRRLYNLLQRKQGLVSLRIVDLILTGLGLPHEFESLYPEGSATSRNLGRSKKKAPR